MNKFELVDLKLYKEKPDNHAEVYYLSAVYKHENDCGVYELTVPKIWLPISQDFDIRLPMSAGVMYPGYSATIDLGFGELDLCPDEDGHVYFEKIIKEKIHDMTLDEIEKKLGYKVRVVSEK